MKTLSKSNSKNKKSFISVALASLLAFSFNYSPISMISNLIKDARAYKASTLQSYYGDATSTTESKIGSGNYPTALAEYFSKSSNNFNIGTYYNTRYSDIFAAKVHDYFKSGKITHTQAGEAIDFKALYEAFLTAKGYDTLLAYYESDKTYINTTYSVSNFMTYVEYFVTHEITWTISDSQTGVIPAVFTNSPERSHFYCAFANFLTNTVENVGEGANGNIDNLPDEYTEAEYYIHSYQYNRVKDFIDDIIVETVAIYSYDGVTQQNTVAGILADGAPVSASYYYKDNSYLSQNTPNINYVKKTASIAGTPTVARTIYYAAANINEYTSALNDGSHHFVESISQDVLEKNILQYRPIRTGEPGYVAGYNAFYKYDVVPFATTNEKFDLYVVDDTVTANEQATYDSMYINVIKSSDITADEDNADDLVAEFTDVDLIDAKFYFKVPTETDLYFDKIVNYNFLENTFNRFCQIFRDTTSNGGLYLKHRNNSNYVVYYDPALNNGTSLDEFLADNPNFSYKIKQFNLAGENAKDYFEISTSFSSYYRLNYKLYFQKIKVNYTEIDDTTYTGDYVTKETPVNPYQLSTHGKPLETYEMAAYGKEIFALVEDTTATPQVTIGSTGYVSINQDSLDDEANRNVYVEVPEYTYKKIYGENERTNKLYFKHEVESAAQIFVLDDDKDAANNEVYKNLYYSVLTTEEYKLHSTDYVKLEATDKNYNKNFDLYYKYNPLQDREDIFVQNELRNTSNAEGQNANAIYIIDDSLTYSDKTAYALNLYTVITTEEFNAHKNFYVLITSDDQNYSTMYTKLYYKYIVDDSIAPEKVIYTYTSGKSEEYQTFYKNTADYVASDYELIPYGHDDYVEGIDLYWKKIRTDKTKDIVQDTYYYFNTSSTITLKANSYYAISFYVNTTGEYATDLPVEASFYLTDSNKYIEDIALEHISTDGEWIKYYMFVATDLTASSAVTLKMYMGDEKSILGSAKTSGQTITSVTGAVLFDCIKVQTINLTDYTKRYVDDKDITVEKHTYNEKETTVTVKVANDIADFNSTNVFDNRAFSTVAVGDNNVATNWDKNGLDWSKMFDFDKDDAAKAITDIPDATTNSDGYTQEDAVWSYYISRSTSNSDLNLKQYQEAYIGGDLSVSIVDEKTGVSKEIVPVEEDEDKDEEKEEDKDEEEDKSEDVLSIEETFHAGNKVLKLENKNKIISLGITSNAFTIEQFRYYKITVWVFAPHKEATASITLNSVVKTASTPTYGSLLTQTISLDACYASYTTQPANEYGWIPCSFYVEGNALHDQLCYLVLSAGADSTVYFDNITVENVSSSAYDTATSDSDNTTNYLSLTPSNSVVSNGITNGYFNNITFKTDYKTPDMTAPLAAKSWTIDADSSAAVTAGIVSTNDKYVGYANNFYTEHNNDVVPYANGFDPATDTSFNNVFAIYAPSVKDNPIEGSKQKHVPVRNTYKIYSAAISASAKSTYEIAFDFFKGYQFDGNLVANLYYGSVDSAKIIATFNIDAANLAPNAWETFKFYITTAQSTASVYLEIGVENATGTCFFKDAYSKTVTKTLEELRDAAIDQSQNTTGSANDLHNKPSLKNYKFIDFATLSSSTHGNTINPSRNTYDVTEYKSELASKKAHTVGKSGVAVATFYDETDPTLVYSVKIGDNTYYIGEVDGETPGEKVYKLYSCKCLCEDNEVTEIAGEPVTVEDFKTVKVGLDAENADEYTSTKTETNNYLYTFENDVTLNNVIIPASELTNKYSDSVMILANSYSTDYLTIEPSYTTTLSKTSFYVLKVYVKTSDFAEEDTGLKINVSSIATSWTNINTTTLEAGKADANGFVCYQIAIKTGNSTIASFGVNFSLGDEKSTCKGYAIIADVKLETFASEGELEHYVSTVEDDETTVKKYYASSSSGSSSNDQKKEDEDNSNWATFFYIFSSLLLALVLGMALVAVFVKKHPIKHKVVVTNDHEKDLDVIQVKKNTPIDTITETDSSNNDESSDDEGGII